MYQNQTQSYEAFKKEKDAEIQKLIEKLESTNKEYIEFTEYTIEKIKREIWDVTQDRLNLSIDLYEQIKIGLPPSYIKADLAVEVYGLASTRKANPEQLAEEIANGFAESQNLCWIEKAFAIKGYINFLLKKEYFYHSVLSNINALGENYGESDVNSGKSILIDYSSPNIAKPMGIHHLRSTILGEALANIYSLTGYEVIRDNHLGDWGMQIGELIYAYETWGVSKYWARNPTKTLRNLYVRFHRQGEKEMEIKQEARKIFWKLEKKDEKYISYWNRFRDLSVINLKEIYKKLGIEFDLYLGESYFVDFVENMVETCIKKGAATNVGNTGVTLVDGMDGLPTFLLRKLDGSSLYITRDLATLQFRIETFDVDEILYVVGNEQEMNFRQLFALAEKIGLLEDRKVKHVGFGLLLIDGKKMSTRIGSTLDLEELLREMTSKCKSIVSERNPKLNLEEIDEISQKIGIACILCNFLNYSNNRNVKFDLIKILHLNDSKLIYLQYTAARILSILEKLDENKVGKLGERDYLIFEEEIEYKISIKSMFFPEILVTAQRLNSPHFVIYYLEELAKLFNNFYNNVSVIYTKNRQLLASRIFLIKSVLIIIEKGLGILNIKVIDKM